MQFSAFKGPFEERIEAWNHKLFIIGEVLDKWLEVRSRRGLFVEFEPFRAASGPRWRRHETP